MNAMHRAIRACSPVLGITTLVVLAACGPTDPGMTPVDYGMVDSDAWDIPVGRDVLHVQDGGDPGTDGSIQEPDGSAGDIDISPDTDACRPWCGEDECGDDGCGGSCGECTGGKSCVHGMCECVAQAYRSCCGSGVCWYDSCGIAGSLVASCPNGCELARCIDCESQCDGKVCGEDGCGGECGQCTSGKCDDLMWTTPAACVDGQCLGGGAIQGCDDGNGCTRDTCDPRFGCGHRVRPDDFTCEPGRCEAQRWWQPRTCRDGECTGGGSSQMCDDGNPCTEDTCFTEAGCIFTPNRKPCDDADPCTTGDTCADGECSGTGVLDCDDGQECTIDSCIPGHGCLNDPLVNGTHCGVGTCSGLVFTPGASCVDGRCTGAGGGPVDCDDGKTCTLDRCLNTGCVHDVIDNNCLIDGACQVNGATKGECLKCSPSASKTSWTTMNACDDGIACTNDTCDLVTGNCRNDIALGKCLIAGTCYSDSQTGVDECQVCTSATSPTDWSHAVDETACLGSGSCRQGECCFPACDGRACGPDGCGGDCGTCPSNFSCSDGKCIPKPQCTVATCPTVAGYNVSCNAQEHCEYRNTNTSGWRQWDVWIYVPPGSFPMGAPDGEYDGSFSGYEKPIISVTFAKGYLIGKYEITVAQYEACRAASPSTCSRLTDSSSGNGWGVNSSTNGRTAHPQNELTWAQAGAVCAWLGGRRPTEAEWEYAAKGPVHRKYPWGDLPEPTCENETAVFDPDGSPRPWGCDPCDEWACSGTSPVGTRMAGAAYTGALDMAGNVFEWAEDWFKVNYEEYPTDGTAWETPTGRGRSYRGGALTTLAISIRSAKRGSRLPDNNHFAFGARCARSMP